MGAGDPRALDFRAAAGVDLAKLCDALNDAYADYPTPFRLTASQLELLLQSRGFDPELSGVAIAGGDVAAAWLTGVRRPATEAAYVIAVGVRRTFLRRGLARALFAFVASRLRACGLRTLGLEVIEKNAAARDLYESLGFEPVRRLACLSAEKMAVHKANGWRTRSVPVAVLETLARQEGDWRPTWQNDVESLRNISEQLDLQGVFHDGACIGAGALIGPTRTVAQIIVARPYRRRGVGAAIMADWVRRHGRQSANAINIDAAASVTLAFMAAHGFAEKVRQLDMVFRL